MLIVLENMLIKLKKRENMFIIYYNIKVERDLTIKIIDSVACYEYKRSIIDIHRSAQNIGSL